MISFTVPSVLASARLRYLEVVERLRDLYGSRSVKTPPEWVLTMLPDFRRWAHLELNLGESLPIFLHTTLHLKNQWPSVVLQTMIEFCSPTHQPWIIDFSMARAQIPPPLR